MMFTYIKLSLRRAWNERSFSALSVAGLTLATVSCTIILLYVSYERSYDDFRSADILRVTYHAFDNNVETGKSAQIVPGLAPAMAAAIPEIKAAVRLVHTAPFMADPVMQYQDKKFRESRIYYADNGFLLALSYNMVSGSPALALDKPNQLVISKSIAKKYFGESDPVGKTFTFHRGERGPREILVTGVFEDIPANSHFHTDFVISFTSLGIDLDSDWDWGNFYTYVQLQPGVNGNQVQSKIPELLNRTFGKYIQELAAQGRRFEFQLQPIHSIHLESKLWAELEVNGDAKTVDFLQMIAIFILLIAWINYINFAIARSSGNSKEISVRKIIGSTRWQLMAQLMTDSAVINLVAICISVAVIQASLPVLKILIVLPDAVAFGWHHTLILVTIFFAGTLCSGLYPAIFISKLNPVALLRSKISRSAISMNMNKALIVFQFTASIVLIVGTITVFSQLSYMRNLPLGLNLEQTLVVKGPAVKDSTYLSTLSFFRNETTKIAGVSDFAVSSSIPGQELQWGRSFNRQESPDQETNCAIVAIDEDFFDLYQATFVAGKNYADGTPLWKDAIIINETAAHELGYAEPSAALDKIVIWHENGELLPKKVIGIVKDFNQQSLRMKVEPIVFTLKEYVFAPWADEFYSFKINGGNFQSSMDQIDQLWKRIYPQNPFDYFFVDEYFNAQYQNDNRFGKVFTVFSALALFIASLGLFGLTAYMTALRTKEIGVRKVLGSTTFQLVRLLSTHYLTLVLIAFVVACPLSYLLMDEWLSQFSYRIDLGAWIFITAGILCFLTALSTVSVKSWQSANMNPAAALKYE
ncbi:MAG TPA: ABC transporter permease [Chryseolinea sp.]|nr:ABC transporter permease [Chryseolinea sp.]